MKHFIRSRKMEIMKLSINFLPDFQPKPSTSKGRPTFIQKEKKSAAKFEKIDDFNDIWDKISDESENLDTSEGKNNLDICD